MIQVSAITGTQVGLLGNSILMGPAGLSAALSIIPRTEEITQTG